MEVRVTQFELRFLDKLEVPIVIRVFSAHDDLTALKEAERLSTTHTIEIWDASRRVARVKKGNVALVTQDRRSL